MAKKNTLSDLSSFLKETKAENEAEEKKEFFEKEPESLVEVEKLKTEAEEKAKKAAKKTAPKANKKKEVSKKQDSELNETAILAQIQELAEREGRTSEEVILRVFTRSKLAQLNPTNFWWDLLLQTHLAYLKMLRSLYDSGLLTFEDKEEK